MIPNKLLILTMSIQTQEFYPSQLAHPSANEWQVHFFSESGLKFDCLLLFSPSNPQPTQP